MKTLFSIRMCVAILAIVSVTAVSAEAQNPEIRVIDINRIFKHHVRFKGHMEDFKKYVKGVEANLKARHDQITAKEKGAFQFKDGSPDRKRINREVLEGKANFTADASEKRKEIMQREAKIYYTYYKEIQDEVAYYCKVKKVAMVIRYNSDKVDTGDRASVMRAVASPIVVQNNIDITDTILRVLNGSAKPNTGPKPGVTNNGGRTLK